METDHVIGAVIAIWHTGYHGSVVILVSYAVVVRIFNAIDTQPPLATMPAFPQFTLIHFATAILAFIQHRISSLLFAPIHR